MTQSKHQYDYWRVPAMVVWTLFFWMGLLPEESFRLMRTLGRVPTQDALINSCHLITLGFAGYLAFFIFRVCREHGESSDSARGKAMQIGILALAAFIALPLARVVYYSEIPIAEYRRLVLGVATVKYLTWAYLFTLIFRYYCIDGARAFLRLPSLFPSVRRQQRAAQDKQKAIANETEQPFEMTKIPEASTGSRDGAV